MAMVQCAWCGGKGVDDGRLNSPCIVCDGDGYVNVPDPPTRCGRCGGTGSIKDVVTARMEKCSGCGGSGWAS